MIGHGGLGDKWGRMKNRVSRNLSCWTGAVVLTLIFCGCEVMDEVARQILLEQAVGTETGPVGNLDGPGIVLSGASARPGDVVTISATLSTGGATVAGAQNDIIFDATVMSIAAGRKGAPDCQVNRSINKGASAFAFIPSRCSGRGCKGVRALILSLTDVGPIANGSKLYSCRVAISGGAAAGSHELGIARVSLSTPAGEAVKATGAAGSIDVR